MQFDPIIRSIRLAPFFRIQSGGIQKLSPPQDFFRPASMSRRCNRRIPCDRALRGTRGVFHSRRQCGETVPQLRRSPCDVFYRQSLFCQHKRSSFVTSFAYPPHYTDGPLTKPLTKPFFRLFSKKIITSAVNRL